MPARPRVGVVAPSPGLGAKSHSLNAMAPAPLRSAHRQAPTIAKHDQLILIGPAENVPHPQLLAGSTRVRSTLPGPCRPPSIQPSIRSRA